MSTACARGRVALCERDNVLLQVLLELVWHSGPRSGGESGLEALFDKPLPHPFHSSRPDIQCLHNLFVGTAETLRLASAISKMRAWFNLRAAVFPTETNLPKRL